MITQTTIAIPEASGYMFVIVAPFTTTTNHNVFVKVATLHWLAIKTTTYPNINTFSANQLKLPKMTRYNKLQDQKFKNFMKERIDPGKSPHLESAWEQETTVISNRSERVRGTTVPVWFKSFTQKSVWIMSRRVGLHLAAHFHFICPQ